MTPSNQQTDDKPDPCEESLVEGSLDMIDLNGISGWAWNAAFPNSPVRVDIFADGEIVVLGVLANKFRDDLPAEGKGNGKHAFETPVPPQLIDGKPHEIRVKIWGPLVEVAGSPQTIVLSKSALDSENDAA